MSANPLPLFSSHLTITPLYRDFDPPSRKTNEDTTHLMYYNARHILDIAASEDHNEANVQAAWCHLLESMFEFDDRTSVTDVGRIQVENNFNLKLALPCRGGGVMYKETTAFQVEKFVVESFGLEQSAAISSPAVDDSPLHTPTTDGLSDLVGISLAGRSKIPPTEHGEPDVPETDISAAPLWATVLDDQQRQRRLHPPAPSASLSSPSINLRGTSIPDLVLLQLVRRSVSGPNGVLHETVGQRSGLLTEIKACPRTIGADDLVKRVQKMLAQNFLYLSAGSEMFGTWLSLNIVDADYSRMMLLRPTQSISSSLDIKSLPRAPDLDVATHLSSRETDELPTIPTQLLLLEVSAEFLDRVDSIQTLKDLLDLPDLPKCLAHSLGHHRSSSDHNDFQVDNETRRKVNMDGLRTLRHTIDGILELMAQAPFDNSKALPMFSAMPKASLDAMCHLIGRNMSLEDYLYLAHVKRSLDGTYDRVISRKRSSPFGSANLATVKKAASDPGSSRMFATRTGSSLSTKTSRRKPSRKPIEPPADGPDDNLPGPNRRPDDDDDHQAGGGSHFSDLGRLVKLGRFSEPAAASTAEGESKDRVSGDQRPDQHSVDPQQIADSQPIDRESDLIGTTSCDLSVSTHSSVSTSNTIIISPTLLTESIFPAGTSPQLDPSHKMPFVMAGEPDQPIVDPGHHSELEHRDGQSQTSAEWSDSSSDSEAESEISPTLLEVCKNVPLLLVTKIQMDQLIAKTLRESSVQRSGVAGGLGSAAGR